MPIKIHEMHTNSTQVQWHSNHSNGDQTNSMSPTCLQTQNRSKFSSTTTIFARGHRFA